MNKFLGLMFISILISCFNPFVSNVSAAESKLNTINLLESNDELIFSEPMTYDEVVQELATNNKISISEAKSIMGKENVNKLSSESKNSTIASTNYRTISRYLDISSNYKPKLMFYCQTSESGSFWGIVSIYHTELYREYNYNVKTFTGNLWYQLNSAYQIRYIINGDFYNTGSTTVGADAEIKIGESCSINFQASVSSSYYMYIFEDYIINVQ